MFDLTFNVEDKGASTPLTLAIDHAVIAGWTGRDPVARDKHIAELEAIGIARPASTPIYYRCSARRPRRRIRPGWAPVSDPPSTMGTPFTTTTPTPWGSA